ncbi:MAG: type I-E CRISPR-associated protein Cas5/CasD [Anaerolineae bacterium]|jgi:CRISPR system Cascade subunit CasD|nr:type I-E CRISPR-associated protein Cas5/CasD [Anaerolineae bacterium]
MPTLLLRLCGPLQAWGVQSHFQTRDTGTEPSKSGVVGLLAAALGRDWSADITDIAGLRMGVRVDQEGTLTQDLHTIADVRRANGDLKPRDITTRWYLADARFLVGLSGELELLQTLHAALADPVWPLYLGRKACVPGEPPWLEAGLLDADLETALAEYPWLGYHAGADLRLVLEQAHGEGELVFDQPTDNFARRGRGSRTVKTLFLPRPADREEDHD